MAVAQGDSSNPVEALVSLGRNQSTKTLLKVIILGLIATAAVASRLFSVIRMYISCLRTWEPGHYTEIKYARFVPWLIQLVLRFA
jgi:dolichyl-diphosphooligosaccharide--protein glycosyltransferase